MTTSKAARTKAARKAPRSSHVPGQLYGYLLQVTRTVAHLLRAHPGQAVSVEFLDDVATQGPDGVVAEQDKSGLAHNPVSNRSLELWKSLHNWVRAIRGGAFKADAKFVLYVAQDHHGDVIDRIHKASSRADADALVKELRIEFWGKAPKHPLRAKLPPDLGLHVNGALSATDDVLALLFMNLTLENGSSEPNDDLLAMIGEKAISEGAREDVLKYLLGWSKRRITQLIEKGLPAILTCEEFHKQLVAAAKKYDRSENLLAPSNPDIAQDTVEKELRERTYVKQLTAVKCPETDLFRAVNDFLRSAVDRTTWSERGDVVEVSFAEFEDTLARAWQNQRDRVEIEQRSNHVEEERGRLVYLNCVGLQLSLQGKDVPSYFVPGSFHTLAETLRVGWHPRYAAVLGTAANEDDPAASVFAVSPATNAGGE